MRKADLDPVDQVAKKQAISEKTIYHLAIPPSELQAPREVWPAVSGADRLRGPLLPLG